MRKLNKITKPNYYLGDKTLIINLVKKYYRREGY